MLDSSRAHQVLSDTDRIVASDRKLTLELLKNLNEIEREKFYLALGYSSMFDYCTQHLKYPEGSSFRRIRTARCIAKYPRLIALLESGEINTTTITAVYKHINPDNADAIIDAIRGKSMREVERFTAALEPVSVMPPARVRHFVVPVPSCVNSTISADGEKTAAHAEEVPSSGSSPCEKKASTPQHNALEFKRMLHVELNMPEERMQKLDRIRSLASHRLRSNASIDDLIDFMADYFLKREDPAQRDGRREARAAKKNETKPAAATVSTNPRQIAAAVKDQIFVRDQQRCTYVGPDGKRCNSTHVLQVDHIKPVARGGAARIDNLRLLCAYHNRLESERLMGKRGPHGLIREAPATFGTSRYDQSPVDGRDNPVMGESFRTRSVVMKA